MTTRARFTLRPAEADDAALLRELFVESRAAELMLDGLPREQAEQLLTLQVAARDRDRALRYADDAYRVSDQVIEADGRPVGHLLVAETSASLRVADLGVLAAERGRGAARYALETWARHADETGRVMTLQVAFGNPAARIYQRLGFEPAPGADVTQQAMRRTPRPPTRRAAHG